MGISSATPTGVSRDSASPLSSPEAPRETDESNFLATNSRVGQSSEAESKSSEQSADPKAEDQDAQEQRSRSGLDDGRGRLIDVAV